MILVRMHWNSPWTEVSISEHVKLPPAMARRLDSTFGDHTSSQHRLQVVGDGAVPEDGQDGAVLGPAPD
jgi:hypothetical protein